MRMKYVPTATTKTPVTTKARHDQIMNAAGGYVFSLDPMKQLLRFLILGSDSPTYYASPKELTADNAKCVIRCWTDHPKETADLILSVSEEGRAPRHSPVLFAVALGTVHSDQRVRQRAYALIPTVCRTGTHLFELVGYYISLKHGWGRGFKRAISSWYDNMDIRSLSYQVIKYRNRNGYTHNRLLDLSHPKGFTEDHKNLYSWIVGKEMSRSNEYIDGFLRAQSLKPDEIIKSAELLKFLPWEAFPTELHNIPAFWASLIPTMGMTALMRNLGRIARLGLTPPLSDLEEVIVKRFTSKEEIKRSRLHPFNVLVAMYTYKSGKGFRGNGTWTPSKRIIEALEEGFYLAFGNVPETKDRTMIGLDVSGSMSWVKLMDSPITPREAAAAMLMVTLRSAPRSYLQAFSHRLHDIDIGKNSSLEDVLRVTDRIPMGGTNGSLLIQKAINEKIPVDKFIVYTDNEWWDGKHNFKLLESYRHKTGIPSKFISVGMTATRSTIADPRDTLSLDVVGFDTSAPTLIQEF